MLCTLIKKEKKTMSRIGKLPIVLPKGVSVDVKDNIVTVKGPKGELKQTINPAIKVEVENGEMKISRPNDERQNRAFHGLYRALINNMVVGVSEGYTKTLELVGVGYRVSNQGQVLEFSLGYSHNIFMKLPDEIKVETKSERNQNPLVILTSVDKQLIGQVCAKIRSLRKPEPYKGKGIRFKGEIVRRKAGKTAAKK
jgi:large subunit ribosomal protein L6